MYAARLPSYRHYIRAPVKDQDYRISNIIIQTMINAWQDLRHLKASTSRPGRWFDTEVTIDVFQTIVEGLPGFRTFDLNISTSDDLENRLMQTSVHELNELQLRWRNRLWEMMSTQLAWLLDAWFPLLSFFKHAVGEGDSIREDSTVVAILKSLQSTGSYGAIGEKEARRFFACGSGLI
ncbi:hypothetical protein BJ165DRAFT_1574213 [Panaeolus papilionaceus]|nr:hypothetical protein BJ165DRAFT_1574213 [Panaeolus papilionaceus]